MTRVFGRSILRRLGLVCVALTAACAVSTRRAVAPPDQGDDPITAEELSQASGDDLYEIVERLRPRWVRARQERTFIGATQVSLIVDGIPRGYIVRLSEYRPIDVAEIRFLSARDATTRYGVDMSGGAIVLSLRRGR